MTVGSATHVLHLVSARARAMSAAATATSCGGKNVADADGDGGKVVVPPRGYEIVGVYPHDAEAFTQGLVVDPERPTHMFESTGLFGASTLRYVEIATGRVVRSVALPREVFGEGITLEGSDRIVVLTWRAGRALVYDRDTFQLLGERRYEGEGWGITTDTATGDVWMSDGSSVLKRIDPVTMRVLARVETGRANLNELEWMPDGSVWANAWLTDKVVVLRVGADTQGADIQQVYDFSELVDTVGQRGSSNNVLNGIARRPGTDNEIYLTGKNWPLLFLVKINKER
jgi:glutamine cyclotransferase